MRIAIASDHAALALKSALVDYVRQQGHDITDLGPHDESSVDYPDYGYKLAAAIADGDAERGIALMRVRHRYFDCRQPQPRRTRCARIRTAVGATRPRT